MNQKFSRFSSDRGMLIFAVIIGRVESELNTNTLIKSAAPLGSTFSTSMSTLYVKFGTINGTNGVLPLSLNTF